VSARLHVRKGDMVIVVRGKDKGKRGKVLRAMPRQGRVVVEGVNMVKKHMRPTRQMMQGGIIEKEAPLHASKVMLYCTRCNRATRVAKKILEGGNKVRICRKCGEVLDR